MSSWIRLGGVVLAAWLAAGCGAGRDVPDVEKLLAERYLRPLEAAGIHPSVQHTCRYQGEAGEPWHLSVELSLDTAQDRVAEVLRGEGIIVVGSGRMTVQQVPNVPRDGWNGSLEASSADTSTLNLVYNNATHSGWDGAVGWAEVCPQPGEVSR